MEENHLPTLPVLPLQFSLLLMEVDLSIKSRKCFLTSTSYEGLCGTRMRFDVLVRLSIIRLDFWWKTEMHGCNIQGISRSFMLSEMFIIWITIKVEVHESDKHLEARDCGYSSIYSCFKRNEMSFILTCNFASYIASYY